MSVVPRKYVQNNLFARGQICLISESFMHAGMVVEKPDKRLHGFQGVFIANVFSVLAVHIEKKL